MKSIRRLLSLRKAIFICHAHEDEKIAEDIALRLRRRKFEAFLDRDSLRPGETFDDRILRAIIRDSDGLIFLISPESVRKEKYTLSELELAKKRWPDPNGRVLPVMIRATDRKEIPSYLNAVTTLEPKGNVVAETAAEIEKLTSGSVRLQPIFAVLTMSIALIALWLWVTDFKSMIASWRTNPPNKSADTGSPPPAPEPQPAVARPDQFPPNFHLMFTLDVTDANPNLIKDIARLFVPAKRVERKIIRQSDEFFDEILDTPSGSALFSATVVREIITGYAGTPPRTSFCLRRRDNPVDDPNKNHVILRCKEGDQPCDAFDSADEGLLSPAQCGPRRAERNDVASWKPKFASFRMFPPAHAEPSTNVWSVPSLESLTERQSTRALRDGFTVFTLRSAAGLRADADGVSLDLAVNDTPVLIGGIPADLQIHSFDPTRPLELKFALQNLNFNGRYAGCDQINIQLQLYKGGEPTGGAVPLKLRYAALRNVENAGIRTDHGQILWSAKYQVASAPNEAGTEWRVLVNWAPVQEISRLQAAQKDIDRMGLTYRDGDNRHKVVAVLRPPLAGKPGIALGLLLDTGQIRFTFTEAEATRLKRFVTEEQGRSREARRLFVGEPDLYREPANVNRNYLCPDP